MKKILLGNFPQILQKMNELSIDVDIYDELLSNKPFYEKSSVYGISIEQDGCNIYIEKFSEFYKILEIKDSTVFHVYEKIDGDNVHRAPLISRETRTEEVYKLRMENTELKNINVNEKNTKKRIKRDKKIFRNDIRIDYYQGFSIYESRLYTGENLKELLNQLI